MPTTTTPETRLTDLGAQLSVIAVEARTGVRQQVHHRHGCRGERHQDAINRPHLAMACRLACVAPRSAGRELLEGGARLGTASNEPSELLAALRMLAADTELRRRLSTAASRPVAECNAVAPVVDAYERVWAVGGRAVARDSRARLAAPYL